MTHFLKTLNTNSFPAFNLTWWW